MIKSWTPYIFCIFICACLLACIKEYLPETIISNNNFLVVEGVINGTPDSPTVIRLSRTRNLTDTIVAHPEQGASMYIVGENGGFYEVRQMGDGEYASSGLRLNPAEKFQLRIQTSDGKEYQSEFVPIIQTPEIDSLNWTLDEDLKIFINTHSQQNNTRYYRWDFDETWEYKALYESFIGFRNGLLFFRDSTELLTTCWQSANSFDILLGTSSQLANDVISQAQLQLIPRGSEKMGVRYSILARQYALEKEAYEYWEILQKTSQELGSIFDAQPSQLRGNLRCVSDPREPVIGYISGSTITSKRLFIRQREVGPWPVDGSGSFCEVKFTSQHPDSARLYFTDGYYSPYYYVTGGLAFAPTPCVDCTTKGGITKRPIFW